MKNGKLGAEDFKELFQSRFGYALAGQMIKPSFGKDVSLVDIGDGKAMATASDPLSYIEKLGAEKSAALSVYLVANDMATTGVMPQYFQLVLNLNEGFTKEKFDAYWQQVHLLCEKNYIAITGGHTGVIPMQNSTVIGGGTMISIADRKDFICCDKVEENDVLLMSKKAAISSTSILGLFFPKTAKEAVKNATSDYFSSLFEDISVLEEGRLAGLINKKYPSKPIHAMHDVTEGGILGAVYEMCVANKKGIKVFADSIPLDVEQKELCQKFEIDPLRSIGAGSMLLSVTPKYVNEVISFYKDNGITLTEIGEFSPLEKERSLVVQNREEALVMWDKDPYWEAFFNALSQNWE